MFRLIKEIISDTIANRGQIWQLAAIDELKTYKGSDLGRVWAFVKPAIYVCGFYMAISIGFKSSKAIEGIICPYFMWLTVGLVVWFYVRDMILGGAFCFRKHRNLILKTRTPSTVIPMIPAMTNLRSHLSLMLAVFVMAFAFGVIPSVYWLQLPLYMGLLIIYAVIWSFFAGCLTVVSRDFYNFLKAINTMIFWLSGIMFDPNASGAGRSLVQLFFKLNPVTFLTEGYRNALCRQVWFFEEPEKMMYFLATMIVLLVAGLLLFGKIKKKLPDII